MTKGRSTYILVIITVLGVVQCAQSDLSITLSRLLQTKNRMNNQMVNMKGNMDSQVTPLKNFIDTLKDLKQYTTEFMQSPLDASQPMSSLKKLKESIAQNEAKYDTTDPLMASFTLSHNNERSAWSLFTKISKSISQSSSFPIQSICNGVKAEKHPDPRPLADLQVISARDICHDVSSCPVDTTLYSNKRYEKATSRRQDLPVNDNAESVSRIFQVNNLEKVKDELKYLERKQKERKHTIERERRRRAPKGRERQQQSLKHNDNDLAVKDTNEDPELVSRMFHVNVHYEVEQEMKAALRRRKERERKQRLERERRRKARERERQLQLKYKEQDVSGACTKEKKCNIQQALPMMTGILKFQINEMIYQRLCPQNCQGNSCNYTNTYHGVLVDINRIIGLSASLPHFWKQTWTSFYKKAVASRAFSNLDVAITMVEEKRNDFELSSIQCYLVGFSKSCSTADIFKQFTLLKKMQQNRNIKAKVKDLRNNAKIDHAKMIQIQKNDIQQIELLGNIKMLDDNLQASVSGISKYFAGLAKFDEGIALTEIDSIKGDLDRYETNLTTVTADLKKNINESMELMAAVVGANLASEIAKLAAVVAENCNPLKLVFAGPDVKDTIEQTGAVANAAVDAVKVSALYKNIIHLTQGASKLREAFSGNSQQISSLEKVVDKIRSGQSFDVGKDAELFVDEYGSYSPLTHRSEIAKNDALWSSFTGAICDLLNGEVGIAGSVPKGIAGGKLVCEKLEGTLAQYFTLREDIYDFQFQLVEQLAAIIKGNIAKRFASDIKGKFDTLNAREFLSGSFLAHLKIQNAASVYCDILEYKRLGKSVLPCATFDGLFRRENINGLISYADNTPHNVIERDVYIPTRADSNGVSGVIDLQALAKGETIIFKIPNNVQWLQQNRWLLPGETTIPFIQDFKLILPRKIYGIGLAKRLSTTQVTLTSIAGSSVSTVNPNTGTVYILQRAQNTYSTIYEEGYSSCSTETANPYSLCSNLPKVCDKTKRITGNSLLPTILSTFSMQVRVNQGLQILNYDAPSPQTPLLLKAKVILKMRLGMRKKRHVGNHRRSDVTLSSNGCCQGNRYRSSLFDNFGCALCPQNTTSFHGGLFCQINETPAQ